MHDKYYAVIDTNVLVSALLGASYMSLYVDRTTAIDELFPDSKDMVFYEVSLSKDGSFLVTGNLRHFPQKSFVITPAEMVELLEKI